MSNYLAGSTAVKYWYPDFNKEPQDTDFFVADKLPRQKQQGVEFLYNPVVCGVMKKSGKCLVVYPDLLLTNAMSHIFWQDDIYSFEKHMHTIQFLIKKGCKFDRDPEIHK